MVDLEASQKQPLLQGQIETGYSVNGNTPSAYPFAINYVQNQAYPNPYTGQPGQQVYYQTGQPFSQEQQINGYYAQLDAQAAYD